MTSNAQVSNEAIVPNAKRLLWAGFMAILAAGVGFALRGGIFGAWASEYSFTATQLGAIGGAGFSGFCFGIIIGGVLVDKFGYGKLVALALLGHVVSAVVTFMASTPQNAYGFLFWGMFIFAYANGTLEAVANPLVATIFPKNRTHFLNILHASWPLGMVVGAVASYLLGTVMGFGWKGQLAFYLVPTAGYALMFMGQSFPKSEAAAKGASFAEMFKDVGILGALVVCGLIMVFLGSTLPLFGVSAGAAENIGYVVGGILVVAVGVLTKFSIGSFFLFILFITHAMVGAVELGTDGWIEAITGNLFTAEQGKILFIWTSAIMFGLRFCANFIETKLGFSPIGLLLTSATLAVIGLQLAAGMNSFAVALVALGIYALGKTFFWPTMLAVVGDRFPRSGAVAMSIMGGIGMLSAGLLGGPGLGYAKDRFTSENLKTTNAAVYEANKAAAPSKFIFFSEVTAVDGSKLEAAKKAGDKGTPEQKAIVAANQAGDRATLKADSFIPLTMAVVYLALLLYFKSIGGYRPLSLEEQKA
jgi:MFS family permease